MLCRGNSSAHCKRRLGSGDLVTSEQSFESRIGSGAYAMPREQLRSLQAKARIRRSRNIRAEFKAFGFRALGFRVYRLGLSMGPDL